MENNKINIAELLRYCPHGMELDSPAYNNLYFDNIIDSDSYPIKCYTTYNGMLNTVFLTKYGEIRREKNAKCVIFPKGKTTWEGFVPPRKFKDGDILYINCTGDECSYKHNKYIFILKEISDGKIYCYCYIDEVNKYKNFNISWLSDMTYTPRFATEEEKQRLFDSIKENGYRWNPETKTLEMLVAPKFKVGDRIRCKNGVDKYDGFEEGIIDTITDNKYGIVIPHLMDIVALINITDQDNWELVTLKFKTGDRIRHRIKRREEGRITNVSFNFYDVFTTDEKTISIPIREQDEWKLVPDKIKSKFKVGDRIKKNKDSIRYTIIGFNDDGFYKTEYQGGRISYVNFEHQDEWELVPDEIKPKFKDGDIISCSLTTCIFKKEGTEKGTVDFYCGVVCNEFTTKDINDPHTHFGYIAEYRLATEEERQKLFDAIKENGYKWNTETKTLEKLVAPKFKVGDRIKHKQSFISGVITNIDDDCYKIKYDSGAVSFAIIKDQDDWELVSDEIQPKFKVGDKIRLKGNPNYIYTITDIRENKSGCGVTFDLRFSEQDKNGNWFPQFDISSLVPFESKVLVRDNKSEVWKPAIFGGYIEEREPRKYIVVGGIFYEYLIPYECNEYLCGKKDDCKEFYKTWKE